MNRLIIFLGSVLVAAAIAAPGAWADTLVEYDLPSHVSGNLAATTVHPSVTATSVSMVGVTNSSFSNHFYSSSWGSSLDLGKYFETTITPNAGFNVTIGDLTYSVESQGVTGNTTWWLRSSLDGFSSDLDMFVVNDGGAGLVTNQGVNLSSLGVLAGPVTFRWYVAIADSGSAGFASHLPGGAGGGLSDVGRNLLFEVPEPATLLLFGFGIVGVAALRRRRKVA